MLEIVMIIILGLTFLVPLTAWAIYAYKEDTY